MQDYYEIYRGYKLICTPNLSHDGQFRTKLIIERDRRSNIEVFEISVQPNTCSTAEDAANVARIAGRMWVDENG
jgi:hypothetical protein